MSNQTQDYSHEISPMDIVPKYPIPASLLSNKQPSGCQACTLQIPSFFCNDDCDGDGGLITEKTSLPMPVPSEQAFQRKISHGTNQLPNPTHHDNILQWIPVPDQMSPSHTSPAHSTTGSPSLVTHGTPREYVDMMCSLCGGNHDPYASLCATTANGFITESDLGVSSIWP
ncbi:hypothetical protein FPSE_00546 [Fusarium pseudograminearum CS3096]|uniref:Uncharacterized protein n=1 Tax=Fusarium pseudograminearum (strain CS3096) TaxID=1028729 RepID=K3W3E0_FUSPC|nr:hypothetical protein FPSE_00546 [Fusarium pseudograminearum CS3096]EKJ79235.1 hypothetical protein FPSE_00546 [Fusarium pseudograminearum CS3096]